MNDSNQKSSKITKAARLNSDSANNRDISIQTIIIRDSNCRCRKTSQLNPNILHNLKYLLVYTTLLFPRMQNTLIFNQSQRILMTVSFKGSRTFQGYQIMCFQVEE